MFERLYQVSGDASAEEVQRLLRRFRGTVRRHQVTLGDPPFVRNSLNRITAVRVRFTPVEADADPSLANARRSTRPRS